MSTTRWRGPCQIGLLFTIAAIVVASCGFGQVRRIATPPPQAAGPPQTTAPPQAAPPPQESRGSFDWQGLVGGLIESQMRQPRPENTPVAPSPWRPGPGEFQGGGGGEFPEAMPVRPPGSTRPYYPNYPPPQYGPPQYGRPQYVPPQYLPPQVERGPQVFPGERVVPAIPGNVIVAPSVTPQPNVVIPEPGEPVVTIPPQQSPLKGRVWEVSGREARCYVSSLGQLADRALTDCLNALGKGVPEAPEIKPIIEQLQALLGKDASWREMEPIVRRLSEDYRSVLSGAALEDVRRAIYVLMARDAFRLIVESEPRGRGVPFDIAMVPVGMVWIIYDPTLAVGTALFVSEHVVVCGGGGRDLYVERGTVAAALGLPVGVGPPVPDIEATAVKKLAETITIKNSESAATAVNFVLNRRESFTIQPGGEEKIPADEKWTVEFDRGGGGGTARYSLSKGCYEFRIVESHWELFKLKFEVTIDNQAGQQDFVYLMNNEVVTVPAGKTQTHVSNDPVVVEFDRGRGVDTPARKNLNKNGTYKVAVNTEDNYLDLFSEEAQG